MNLSTVRTLAFGVPLLVLAALSTASAQYGPGYPPQQQMPGGYPVQQAYMQQGQAGGMVAPASYCPSGDCGMMGYGGGGFGGGYYDGCGCSGYGCDGCGGGAGPVGRFFHYLFTRHGPQGDGAFCRPRFYDIQFEVVNFLRDEVTGEPQGFFSSGIGTDQPIVLSTSDLDFNEELGVSLVGNYMISANTFVEFRWLGGFDWTTNAAVDSETATGLPDNLYSVFSEFGTNPNNPMQVGFPETDAADSASINYHTTLDSFELNMRRRWVSDNCFFHYSLFLGARYVKLDESFNLGATVLDADRITTGAIDYNVDANNDMAGFQIGGDLLFNVTKRLRLGGDLKAGIYGNQSIARTMILLQAEDELNPGTLLEQTIEERVQKAEAAFVGEFSLYALFHLTDRWTVRAGYDMLYLNNVALAVENFNSDATFFTGSRTPFINNTGDALYHGATGGFEFSW